MTLTQQILWGTGLLALCLILHSFLLAVCAELVGIVLNWHQRLPRIIRVNSLILIALWIIVFAHTFQVWIWAFVWISFDVLPNWNEAVYFSLVTYTSLGYGDIVLEPEFRVFGAFASVTGLLGFGLSTALLVAMMNRLIPFLKLPKQNSEN